MKKHVKKCRYCNKQFYSTRIDALYCSASCRNMASRYRNEPELYSRVNSIHFELDKEQYKIIKDYCSEINYEIGEYVKLLCFEEINKINNKKRSHE